MSRQATGQYVVVRQFPDGRQVAISYPAPAQMAERDRERLAAEHARLRRLAREEGWASVPPEAEHFLEPA